MKHYLDKRIILKDPVSCCKVFTPCHTGFSLLELLAIVGIIGTIITLAVVRTDPLLERWNLSLAAGQVEQALRQAQMLALTQHRSYQVVGRHQELWLHGNSQESNDSTLWETLPQGIDITANRWPRFSAYGFASGGTISIESTHYLTQIKVSPLGRIHQTEIQQK